MRTWPALEIQQADDDELIQAFLIDFNLAAIEGFRFFFHSIDDRDRAAAALRAEFRGIDAQSIDVPDEDWAARSQASLRAVRVGNIVVAPPWDVPAGPVVIIIQPSMGFGTGHHATTRLCIDALQRLNIAGRTVLDVGTGSGVLAIAASLLGASRSVGIDDDADAITAAHENLQLNPQAEATLLVADLRATDVGSADIVIANLTGGLLISAARALQDLVARGGSLVLSGLMAVEETDVLAAFPAWSVNYRSEEDEWLCVVISPPQLPISPTAS